MLKVVELFAGIGAPRKALNNLNIDHEIVAFSEIDKYAEISYRAIHEDDTTPNSGDINQIKELPDCDLITYGFPCQDISIAGYGKGIKEGTRSGLLLEVERLLNVAEQNNKLPKYLLMENVAALVSKKHIKDFEKWLVKLEKLGYKNFYKILNAKDYGIPQNRERIFVVSILGKHEPYQFPEKQELKLRLRDLLDNEVPENYYLKDEKVQDFISRLGKQGYILRNEIAGAVVSGQIRNNLVLPTLTPDRLEKRQNGRRFKNNDDPSFTLTAQDRHGVTLIGSLTDKNSQGERVYTTDIAVTQNANGGGLGAKTGLYLVTGGSQKNTFVGDGSYSPCLTSAMGLGGGHTPLLMIDKEISYCLDANYTKGTTLADYFNKKRRQLVTDCTLRIRRLTPLECWRLMGFTDEDFKKIKAAGISNSQAYKQAGNSIVVNVLERIFENLYKNKTAVKKKAKNRIVARQLSLF